MKRDSHHHQSARRPSTEVKVNYSLIEIDCNSNNRNQIVSVPSDEEWKRWFARARKWRLLFIHYFISAHKTNKWKRVICEKRKTQHYIWWMLTHAFTLPRTRRLWNNNNNNPSTLTALRVKEKKLHCLLWAQRFLLSIHPSIFLSFFARRRCFPFYWSDFLLT